MYKQIHTENLITFVLWKTKLPIDIVEALSEIEIPTYWDEGVRTILENYNNPGAMTLYEKMIEDREKFVEKLSMAEIDETYEIQLAKEYILRLVNDGGVEQNTAAIFAKAVLEWHRKFEEAIINALLNKTSP
jgi:hypothetical protein